MYSIHLKMNPNRSSNSLNLDINTTKYLLGELGIAALVLIRSGCRNDFEIMKLSTISANCLEVKIPLLNTLGLIEITKGEYQITPTGESFADEVSGWENSRS